MSILLLLSNKAAKAHAFKKFSWLRICQNKPTEDRIFELSAIVVDTKVDGVDKTGSKEAGAKKIEVEENKIGEARMVEA